jgi:arylsulfatase A-like enzyme
VTLDTTRPDFFGAWGCEGDPTPNFDALAREGTRFSTAVSSSAVTPVSHASILTGLAPYEHGLRILAGPGGFRLPPEVPTLATVLRPRGYATGAIHSAFPVSKVYGFERDFDLFQDMGESGLEQGDEGWVSWDVGAGQRRSDVTNQLVLDFLERVQTPFFLWVHYWDPHDDYFLPPAEFLAARGLELDERGMPTSARARYGAEVGYVDLQFGQVIEFLKRKGLYDETLIAVVADHGEGLDDGWKHHGWAAHRILYQEQMHVPLILRIPGAPGGRTVDALVRTVDIFPTLLDYLDIAPPGELEGRSLKRLIEGRPDEPRVAYADQINLWDANAKMVETRPQSDFIHVLMDDEWKLIFRPSFPRQSELYAYRTDPDELTNLFSQRKDVSVPLLQELARRGGWVLAPFAADGGGMSEHDLKRLGDLGYLEGGAELSADELADMWEWLCPVEWRRWPTRGACPTCGSECLPVRKGKP